MKEFKPVIIAAAVFLAVVIAAVIVMNGAPKPQQSPAADTPIGVELPESIRVMDFDSTLVASLDVTGGDESWSIDYEQAEIGIKGIMRDANPKLIYDQYSMTAMSAFVCSLTAIEEIGEGADADFGFDKPQRKISLNFKDGTTKTLLIGNDLTGEDGLYVRCEDETTIYAVGALAKENLMQKRTEFLSFSLFPEITDTADLTFVEYTESGKRAVSVALRPEEDIARDTERMGWSVNYSMSSPVSALTNPRTIDEELFDKVIAIEGVRVVEELPDDLAKYGLKSPSKLKFRTKTGISASLLIGGETPDGGTYVMPEGVPMVIETAAPVNLREFDYKKIMYDLLFFFNSKEVKSIDYSLPSGESHTFNIELEEHLVRGNLDGVKLEGRNAGNLFQRTICISASGELDGSFEYKTPDIKITAKLHDGSSHTMLLYRANERQYGVEVDGKRDNFYVAVAEVDALLEAFDLIKNGKEIPDMF